MSSHLDPSLMVLFPYTPWKLTWQWKIPMFNNRKYIFKWLIFHRQVRFRGCNIFQNQGSEDLRTTSTSHDHLLKQAESRCEGNSQSFEREFFSWWLYKWLYTWTQTGDKWLYQFYICTRKKHHFFTHQLGELIPIHPVIWSCFPTTGGLPQKHVDVDICISSFGLWNRWKSAEKKLLMEEIRLSGWYGSFSHYLQGFYTSQVVSRISSINSVSMLSNTLELVPNLPVNKKWSNYLWYLCVSLFHPDGMKDSGHIAIFHLHLDFPQIARDFPILLT